MLTSCSWTSRQPMQLWRVPMPSQWSWLDDSCLFIITLSLLITFLTVSHTFRFSTPGDWNSLPVTSRESQSLPTFRRHLKTLLSVTSYFQTSSKDFTFGQPNPSQLPTLRRTSLSMHPDSSKTLALYKSLTYLLLCLCGLLATGGILYSGCP